MKDKAEIQKLLEKFYDGLTTEAEEALLKDYFLSDNVAETLSEERAIFLAMCESEVVVPADLASKLDRQINQWNTIERTTRKTITRNGMRWIVGIAASILVLVAVGVFIDKHEQKQLSSTEEIDTYDNPEDAYATTRKALTKFSKSLNKGLQVVENATNKQVD